MIEIEEKLLDYILLKYPETKTSLRHPVIKRLTCPFCKDERMTARYTKQIRKFRCSQPKCNKELDIYDLIRQLEIDKKEYTNDEIDIYVSKLFDMKLSSEKEIEEILKYYEDHDFDMVEVAKNAKECYEEDWPNKHHRSIEEWKEWLQVGSNIGVKTGKISNLLVLDVDTKDIDEELKENVLKDYVGIIQETNKGYHFFYEYEPSLKKTRIDKFKLDIETDGGQIVIYPSIVEGKKRILHYWTPTKKIPKLSEKALKFLQDNIKNYKPSIDLKPIEELVDVKLPPNDDKNFKPIDLDFVHEGNRTNFLMKFGGILRKELNSFQVQHVLNIVNQHFLKPPLPIRELNNISTSIDKYINFDHSELANKILGYLRIVGDATARDIKEITNEKKESVDKALAHLIKEGYILKHSRLYQIIKKAEWKDTFDSFTRFPYKVPYFNEIAHFNVGDLLLLGMRSKFGKTTVSQGILREFVKQGIKPYYLSSESGSRFQQTAKTLGMKEGDFFWDFVSDPTKIELEPNAVTIIDWLLIADKSITDSVFKYFVEQLYKTKGFLIIFQQLKTNYEWFAPNFAEQFPSLAARYIYDEETSGETGYWQVDSIRESKHHAKKEKIRCRYDFNTRELKVIE